MTVINAKEGLWLTQASPLKDENSRQFVKQVAGFNVKAEDWRDATDAEKEQWEKEHSEHPDTPSYEELVVKYIREKYTIDAELAIQRQRDTKPEDFAEYFAYCEDCKRRAKEVL